LLNAALAYAARGWHVFPSYEFDSARGLCACGRNDCPSPGKHPYTQNGYKDASTSAAQIRKWWDKWPSANISIATGRVSGLVVVDIDQKPDADGEDSWRDVCPNEPETVQAQTGSGARHLLFEYPPNLEDGAYIPSRADALAVAVDTRADNGYIIAPPSNHKSGGNYEWMVDAGPEDLPLAQFPGGLLSIITRANTSAASGAANITGFPFSFSPWEIADINDALFFIPADYRETWLTVGMALHSTGCKESFAIWVQWSKTTARGNYKLSAQMATWRSFANTGKSSVITINTLFHEAKKRGWVRGIPMPYMEHEEPPLGDEVPDIVVVEDAAPARPPLLDEPSAAQPIHRPLSNPADLPKLPGVLGEFHQWVMANAAKHQPLLYHQAALAFGCAVTGRRYRSTGKHWPTLYMLNVGMSGCGKEASKQFVERALLECGLGELCNGGGYTSEGAVFTILQQNPSHLTIIDELAHMLASVKAGDVNRSGVVRQLLELWGRTDGQHTPPIYSGMTLTEQQKKERAAKPVQCPAVSMLAMTTPRAFFSAIGSEAIRNGFLNRLLIAVTTEPIQLPDIKDEAPLPHAVVEWAAICQQREHGDLAQGPFVRPSPRVVEISRGAVSLARDYGLQVCQEQEALEKVGLGDMYSRTFEMCYRLATLYAVSVDPVAPVINPSIMESAMEYVDMLTTGAIDSVNLYIADTKHEGATNEVLRALRRDASSNGITMSHMMRVSPYKQFSRRELSDILETLVLSGQVEQQQAGGVTSTGFAGRPTVKYKAVHVEDAKRRSALAKARGKG
jgi:hypothetical protein